MSIPVAIPQNTPPTIVAALGEALLLLALEVEIDCEKEPLAVLVESGTTRDVIDSVLMRVVPLATVV